MDTPNYGVVTHQNCLAVQALRDAAEMAEWLERPDIAADWRETAEELAAAINAQLWNVERQAYTDCLREGQHSQVFSQQTQTAALISGVATGARGRTLPRDYRKPARRFRASGQPILRVLPAGSLPERETRTRSRVHHPPRLGLDGGNGRDQLLGKLERRGSSRRGPAHAQPLPRLVGRAHLLPQHLRAGRPARWPRLPTGGYRTTPRRLDLVSRRCPDTAGDIDVQWERPAQGEYTLRVRAPEGIEVDIRSPYAGSVHLNGRLVTPGHNIS